MKTILKIALAVPLRKLFDYLPPDACSADKFKPGVRLSVPFGRQKLVGYLVEISDHSNTPASKLKKAERLLDETPLISSTELTLLKWACHYYHHPIGEVIASAFPVLLRKGEKASLPLLEKLIATENGLKTHQTELQRAPRQAALIHLLQTNQDGITFEELDHLDWNWRAVAKSLAGKGLCETQLIEEKGESLPNLPPPLLALNHGQEQAVNTVSASLKHFTPFLLEGITGSGKTEVYLRLIQSLVEQGKQAMVLLPEITLTPQLESRFQSRFPIPIATYHSGMSEKKRLHHWLRFQRGDWPILLGTRSALFTPMKNPGIIILDEEHDNSFKQQEGFRYSARDLAIYRAKLLNIPVLLGSATPSLESLYNCQRKRYQHLHLNERAGKAEPPTFRLLDLRNQKLEEGLSPDLIKAIRQTIGRNEQVLLFLNRRGFAPVWLCHHCGHTANCPRCHSKMVFHQKEHRLTCHHCGHQQQLFERCPKCRLSEMQPVGMGTERVEQALTRLFPNYPITRIDRDTTRRKGDLKKLLAQANSDQNPILIGTQMLAKGHHFPNITLVGILDVDQGLFSADFRASEKMAQMIIQVAGRAGRVEKPGTVLLQTHHPEHPLLLSLITQGYATFAREAMLERSAAQLPPFGYQALFRAEATGRDAPHAFLQETAVLANRHCDETVEIFGPVPAPMERRAGRFRAQLLLQCHHREPLHTLLDRFIPLISSLPTARQVRWSLDIDPIDLY